MTKRLLCVLLIAVLLLGCLVGCGDAKKKDKEKKSKETTTTAAPTTTTTAVTYPTYYVTADALNVRRQPDAKSDLLGQLPYGMAVQVLSSERGWHRISYEGEPAYISADYVSLTPPPSKATTTTTTTAPTTAAPLAVHTIVCVTANKLNVRSAPVDGSVLGMLMNGETVEILGVTKEGWYQIEFEGNIGYISPLYVVAMNTTSTTKKAS